jgi:hypothetical protein
LNILLIIFAKINNAINKLILIIKAIMKNNKTLKITKRHLLLLKKLIGSKLGWFIYWANFFLLSLENGDEVIKMGLENSILQKPKKEGKKGREGVLFPIRCLIGNKMT